MVEVVVVAAAAGLTETHPKTTVMETGNFLLVKVPLMRLMLQRLMKGAVVMVHLVDLSEVDAEVVSAMEKR